MAREIRDGSPASIATSDAAEHEEDRARGWTYWRSLSDEELANRTEHIYGAQPVASTSRGPRSPRSTVARQTPERPSVSQEERRLARSSPLPSAPEALPSLLERDQSPLSSLPPSSSDSTASDQSQLGPPSARTDDDSRRLHPMPTDTMAPTAGRSLRQRSAVQQNPYTAEHLRYALTLNQNGWEDAVLRLPRWREETDEERRERRARQAHRGRDDLEGWLILEDGSRVRRDADADGDQPTRGEDDDDMRFEPRDTWPVPEPHRNATRTTRPRIREYDDSRDRLRDPHPRRRRTSVGGLSVAASTPARSARSSSEPLASTPRQRRVRYVVDIDSSTSGGDEAITKRPRMEEQPVVDRLLKGKRKKALGAMMPAAFMKRAARDLELMKHEKLARDHGSGDETSTSSGSDDNNRPGRATVRKRDHRDRGPLDLNGQDYTDGSTESDRASSEDEPPIADAVANWLGAFGGRRKAASKQRDRRDWIDKLLVQSRRDGKPRRAKHPRTTSRKQQRQTRLPFTEKSNLPSHPRSATGQPPARRRPRQTINVDADSLFVPAAVTVIPAVALSDVRAKPVAAWDAFGRFSHDFDITPLPCGLTFTPESYIGRGHLRKLIDFLRDHDDHQREPFRSTLFAFGVTLDSGRPSADIAAVVPRLCDSIYEELSTSSGDHGTLSFVPEACEGIHWLACYANHLGDAAFTSEVDVQLSHLQSRIQGLALPLSFAVHFEWAFLEFALRSRQDSQAAELILSSLVQRLLEHNSARLYSAVKAWPAVEVLNPEISTEIGTLEIWVCILRLVADTSATSVASFWRLIELGSEAKAAKSQLHPVQASEALAFTSMMLCAFSQFSIAGVVTRRSSLAAHWPVVTASLQRMSPAAFVEDVEHISNTALQRRDGYVSALFNRSLILVDRWGWRLDSRDGLLPRLFDVLNWRQLASLATDGTRDFPSFLQEFDGSVGTEVDRRGDTAFHVFLKLFVHYAKEGMAESETERRRALGKLVTRITPQRKMPFRQMGSSTRLSAPRSILINHYSLFMVLALVSPSSAQLRLTQIRNLLAFEDADDEARLILLRAIMYIGILFGHLQIDLQPLLAWVAHICRFLQTQYLELESSRAKVAKNTALREPDEIARNMFGVATSLSTLLRSIQHMLLAETKIASSGHAAASPRYPSLALLGDAWIRDLLQSPLAQDPLIGAELLKCIETYLSLRDTALAPAAVSISQDEFGGIPALDYEDPALAAMLGLEPSSDAIQRREADDQFARLAHECLSPALYRLITAAYVKDAWRNRFAPVVNARGNEEYVRGLVECWARCATVVVKAGLREWHDYIVWGPEVWKRLSENIARREVALRFFVHVIEADAAAFLNHKEDFFSVWCQSVVAKKLTLQHRLTSAILNADTEPMALLSADDQGRLPFARDDASGRFEITFEDFETGRATLLEAVFERARCLILDSGPVGRTALAHLANMCAAAKDYLESFDALEAHAKASYSMFVRTLVLKMQTIVGTSTTDALPALSLLRIALDKADATA